MERPALSMWSWILETFAEVLGATRRTRIWVVVPIAGLTFWLCLVLFIEGGPRVFLALALVLGVAVTGPIQVARARDALFRAARLPLLDPEQPPPQNGEHLPPTARSLHKLAAAVDRARRGDHFEAAEALEQVDRDRLRPSEERLFQAARALVSLGLGDARRAAALAAHALPTGSEDLDRLLGRTRVTEAWSNEPTLRRIDSELAAEGVLPGTKEPLPRLRAIVRIRIDPGTIEGLETWEARALADEARAVGDEALAADLEAKSRPSAYR